jgi:hypothetical protein
MGQPSERLPPQNKKKMATPFRNTAYEARFDNKIPVKAMDK